MHCPPDTNMLYCVLILLLSLTLGLVVSHPQCINFKTPFTLFSNLTFCSQYSKFGCCSHNEDFQLQQKYEKIHSSIGKDTWTKCQDYIKGILCEQCSPHSSHTFHTRIKTKPPVFPGLCKEYCHEFYISCRDILHFIDKNRAADDSFSSITEFCDGAQPVDNDYCFPDLISNPLFNEDVGNVQITGEGCLCLEEVVSKLGSPTVATHAADGSGRLFISEQVGVVHVYFPRNKTRLKRPFLDIRNKVKTTPHKGDERGFLGLIFHPEHVQNGKFYVFYSTNLEKGERRDQYGSIKIDHKTKISEFTVSSKDPNQADVSSERTLLEVYEPYSNHNGGQMIFGDDTYLLLFLGDGGYANDPHGFAQNKSVLLGKVLRIDVNTKFAPIAYAIPPDNPFIDEPGARPEIYAYGVRNIWRCGLDRGDPITGEGKGRIVCGDVGQGKWEELDVIKKGANYGWNTREGFSCFKKETCGHIGPEELPIFAYSHREGKSVTGGSFYRGCQSPNLNGMYIWGDYMSGRLYRIIQNSTGQWENKELFMCGSDVCSDGLIGHYERYIISFGEDEEGEVYLLSTGDMSAMAKKGRVYKIVDPSSRNTDNCQHIKTKVE